MELRSTPSVCPHTHRIRDTHALTAHRRCKRTCTHVTATQMHTRGHTQAPLCKCMLEPTHTPACQPPASIRQWFPDCRHPRVGQGWPELLRISGWLKRPLSPFSTQLRVPQASALPDLGGTMDTGPGFSVPPPLSSSQVRTPGVLMAAAAPPGHRLGWPAPSLLRETRFLGCKRPGTQLLGQGSPVPRDHSKGKLFAVCLNLQG